MRSLTASSDDPGKNKRFCRDVFMCGKGIGIFAGAPAMPPESAEKPSKTRPDPWQSSFGGRVL
jgi:hypothetical protein